MRIASFAGRTKRQLGLTLIEVLASLGLIAAAVTGAAYIVRESQETTKAAAASEYMSAVVRAATQYVVDNRAAVLAGATASQPYLVRVNELVAGNYLAGFNARNGYDQAVCVLVLEPTANRLRALVVAEGGQQLDDATLGQVASGIGADGGGIYSNNAGLIQGTGGGWTVPSAGFAAANHAGLRCDGTAGSVQLQPGRPMAVLFDVGSSGGVQDALLHRDAVPGRPELNQMNTPLVLNSVHVEGAACTSIGSVAREASGVVLWCSAGRWSKPAESWAWGSPVPSVADLGPCIISNRNQVRTVDAPIPRPYVCTGVDWEPVALDVFGNLSVPGDIRAAGRVSAGEFLQVGGVVVSGDACAEDGLIARDAGGTVLSCAGGSWRTPGQPPGMVAYFAGPSCGPGWVMPDGGFLNPATNPGLFSVIGVTYGGDGVATYRLPDLRGEFLRGVDAGRGADPGRVLGSSQGDAIRNIEGRFVGMADGHPSYVTGPFKSEFWVTTPVDPDPWQWTGKVYTFDASRVVPVAPENRPRNVAMTPCMKL